MVFIRFLKIFLACVKGRGGGSGNFMGRGGNFGGGGGNFGRGGNFGGRGRMVILVLSTCLPKIYQ